MTLLKAEIKNHQHHACKKKQNPSFIHYVNHFLIPPLLPLFETFFYDGSDINSFLRSDEISLCFAAMFAPVGLLSLVARLSLRVCVFMYCTCVCLRIAISVRGRRERGNTVMLI